MAVLASGPLWGRLVMAFKLSQGCTVLPRPAEICLGLSLLGAVWSMEPPVAAEKTGVIPELPSAVQSCPELFILWEALGSSGQLALNSSG